MSETRDDLWEAPAVTTFAINRVGEEDICVDGFSRFVGEPEFLAYKAWAEAQVSVLQAEVEATRALNRDLHRRTQKAESFRARHGNTYGVKARWAGRQALRKALAEVERLQKVEGERGRLERVTSSPGYSGSAPSPQAVSASGEYPSRESVEVLYGKIKHARFYADREGFLLSTICPSSEETDILLHTLLGCLKERLSFCAGKEGASA